MDFLTPEQTGIFNLHEYRNILYKFYKPFEKMSTFINVYYYLTFNT